MFRSGAKRRKMKTNIKEVRGCLLTITKTLESEHVEVPRISVSICLYLPHCKNSEIQNQFAVSISEHSDHLTKKCIDCEGHKSTIWRKSKTPKRSTFS